jgi:hypothetical protein
MGGEGPARFDHRGPAPEPPPRMASVRPAGLHWERGSGGYRHMDKKLTGEKEVERNEGMEKRKGRLACWPLAIGA